MLYPFPNTESFYSSTTISVPYRGATVSTKIEVSRVTESMLHSDSVVGVLEYGVSPPSRFVQVFRASSDNINCLNLFLSGVGTSYIKDDFEYTDDENLRSSWVTSDATNTPISLDNDIKYNGDKSLRIQVSGKKSNGDTITKTMVAENWGDYEYAEFAWRSTADANNTGLWEFRIGDGVNWASAMFSASSTNTWEIKRIALSSMDNIGIVNLNAITKIQFRCIDGNSKHEEWCDYLVAFAGSGSVKVRMYDFGGDYSSISVLPPPMVFDNGMDYVDVNLNVDFDYRIVPIRKSGLRLGNYYGIGVEEITSAKCYIHGSNVRTYKEGVLYSVDDTGVLTSTGRSMFFIVSSNDSAYLLRLSCVFDQDPGSSRIVVVSVGANDNLLSKLIDVEVSNRNKIEFEFDVSNALAHVPKSGKLNFMYLDDSSSSSVRKVNIETLWVVKGHKPWG